MSGIDRSDVRPPAVSIAGLAKSYGGRLAVADMSLRLESGTFTALLGPSGCGKSTTLEIIAGLLAPDCGQIAIDGTAVTEMPAERRPVSLVFQKPLLFPHLSVAQNVGFGLRMQGRPRKVIAQKVNAMLDRVQLGDFGNRRVQELSGGQEQRVALARALVLEPKVLLLDEPFSQLDALLRVEMRRLVRELHEASDVTTVFVTHDQAEAVDVADEIVLMLDGRIEGCGTPEQLYTSPPTLKTARFFGVTNELVGVVRDGVFNTEAGDVHVDTLADNGPALLTIRPESILPVEREPQADGVFVAVLSVRFAGTHLVVVVSMKDDQTLTLHAPVATRFSPGDQIVVKLSPERCTVFRRAPQ